ncbi:EVE domain-containing protein [Bartonella sp. DGB1]|uniref:EVE domain-containing protein n=1 Tax=Bartonella sp. DGB1 TaxID=3239807 RepID=UPI0035256413
MAYWLVKSEPDVWSWQQQKAKGKTGEAWSGVRNYTARNYMRLMQLGEKVFFYHSNIGKEIVGIAEVSAIAKQDPTTDDKRWECVELIAYMDLPRAVTLKEIKSDGRFANMALVKHTRLSVQPVTEQEWRDICNLAGLTDIII